jgi:N-acyl-D-aspartate/D-glutamate deacylase
MSAVAGVGGFLERLASRGVTVNVGSLAPLNQLRVDVVGTARRPARPEELEEMRRRLDQPRLYPEGVDAVVVNGVVTVRGGALTAKRAGRPLLGPGAVPARSPS